MAAKFAYRLGWRSLKKVVPTLTNAQARALARDLAQAMHEHGIVNERRAAAFIAQTAHESAAFRAREEFASGAAYEGRHDLGNVRRGDGVRFKGRSYIQITGRSNYRALPHWDGINFERHPTRLAAPKYAAKGAAYWWSQHGCNAIADSGDFVALTRRINGGINGLAERQAYHARAKQVAKYLVPRRRPPT